MPKKIVLWGVVLLLGIFLFQCSTKKTDILNPVSPTQTQPIIYNVRGYITGKVYEPCTNNPVGNAVVSLGFQGGAYTTRTDQWGSYAFADVPASQDETGGVTGTYRLTLDLTDPNNTIATGQPKFRQYYYGTVTVAYRLNQGQTNAGSGDHLIIQGLAASLDFPVGKLNTAIVGQIVDPNYAGVANATVRLFMGSSATGLVIATTTADGSGNYTFNDVENGITVDIKATSSDNKQSGELTGTWPLPCNQGTQNLRQQVTAERVQIVYNDNVAPFVTLITPANGADVSSTGLSIVYKFSEPIAQTALTRTDLPVGSGTILDAVTFAYNGFKKIAGNVTFTAAWNGTFDQLTITPRAADIVGSGKYTITIANVGGWNNLKDIAGNALVNNANITGDNGEALNFTTAGGSPVPTAPILVRRVNDGTYFPLDFVGGNIGLEWGLDANARSYNVYKSVDGGTFNLLNATPVYNVFFQDASGFLVTDYNGVADRDPFRGQNVRYLVRALSKDLVESSDSNVLTISDDVKPQVAAAAISVQPGPTDFIVVQFTEPLNVATAENIANYAFQRAGLPLAVTLSRAVYLGFVAGPNTYQVRLILNDGQVAAADVIIVLPAVTDLSTPTPNGIDPAVDRRTL